MNVEGLAARVEMLAERDGPFSGDGYEAESGEMMRRFVAGTADIVRGHAPGVPGAVVDLEGLSRVEIAEGTAGLVAGLLISAVCLRARSPGTEVEDYADRLEGMCRTLAFEMRGLMELSERLDAEEAADGDG